jgi:hypothetical protein
MCYAEFIEALFDGRIETTVRYGGGVGRLKRIIIIKALMNDKKVSFERKCGGSYGSEK